MSESAGATGAVLEHEHHRIDETFAAFVTALERGNVDSASFKAAGDDLRHHIYVEETYHFPPLREAGMMGPIMVMLAEHGRMWDLLDSIQQGIDQSRPAAELLELWTQLATTIADHNMKEEHILYPAGDNLLDAETASQILRALESGELPSDWECEMVGRSGLGPA